MRAIYGELAGNRDFTVAFGEALATI